MKIAASHDRRVNDNQNAARPRRLHRPGGRRGAKAFAWLPALSAAGLVLWFFASQRAVPTKTAVDATIRGQVADENGPLAGCVVRIKGHPSSVETGADGRFRLPDPALAKARVVASKQGYFIGGADWPCAGEVRITLRRHPAEDCADYHWTDPRPNPQRPQQCGNCHGEIFREWSASAHARSATNPRFLNVYEGTDARGHDDVGWNLLAEYPEGAGVCYSCHFPSTEPTLEALADLRSIGGVHRQGIHCDFCHKVADVSVEHVGLNHGRFAMKLLRPSGHEQVFFGPLDDVDRGDDVYLPLYRESRYCASCHEGVLFGTHAYSTYSEWLASPQAKMGIQCQDCHMAPTGRMTNIAPGHGGVRRDPATLASHRMPGADAKFLRDHLSLTLSVRQVAEGIEVVAEVRPRGVGHRTPTGHPSRALILWVRAWSDGGGLLPLVEGTVLPPLAGQGDVRRGNLAGQPGWMYAKVLEDLQGNQPVPYWRVTRVAYDSRLYPERPDRRRFVFGPGGSGKISVAAHLIYRRFSKYVADEKGWADNEFVVAQSTWSR